MLCINIATITTTSFTALNYLYPHCNHSKHQTDLHHHCYHQHSKFCIRIMHKNRTCVQKESKKHTLHLCMIKKEEVKKKRRASEHSFQDSGSWVVSKEEGWWQALRVAWADVCAAAVPRTTFVFWRIVHHLKKKKKFCSDSCQKATLLRHRQTWGFVVCRPHAMDCSQGLYRTFLE